MKIIVKESYITNIWPTYLQVTGRLGLVVVGRLLLQ